MIRQGFCRRFARTLVIVVSPHPDDSVLGAGGFIHRLTDRAAWERQAEISEPDWPVVYTIVMTSGSRGVDDEYLRRHAMNHVREVEPALGDYLLRKVAGRDDSPENERALGRVREEVRRRESLAEARLLGVRESVFLNLRGIYHDHTISDEDRHAVSQLIHSLLARHPDWPRLFLVPHRDDMHPVHSLCTSLVGDFVEKELRWQNTAVWQYESPWITFSPHQVEYVVAFDGIGMATKAEAMAVHRSQEYRTKYSDVARYAGQMRAETFPELLGGFGQPGYHWDYVEAFQELRRITVFEVEQE